MGKGNQEVPGGYKPSGKKNRCHNFCISLNVVSVADTYDWNNFFSVFPFKSISYFSNLVKDVLVKVNEPR